MIRPGLVSITFRQLAPREVVALVARTGLTGIEWGGDVHVPHGDVQRARQVRQLTVDAGLEIPAYGSYYRVGHQEPCPFEAVLETAVALGTPVVRVWAGKQGSAQADRAYWDRVIDDSRRIADLAAASGVTVAYEFHGGTLTDTNASAKALLEAADHDNVLTYWQPPRGASTAYCLEGLEMVLPWLCHVHAFTWRALPDGSSVERLALAAGTEAWRQYLAKAAACGHDLYAEIEFVRDDAPERLEEDAATLVSWLAAVQGEP
ncbi:MAG: sugar phosphate isomerase/epimerase [Anaerolineae bacterium]|nr:sugar phosphate isomerase/epimerase [Anaerolineae bacterium]